jgi:hypothetical protein
LVRLLLVPEAIGQRPQIVGNMDFASVVVVRNSAVTLEFSARAAPITTADTKLVSLFYNC